MQNYGYIGERIVDIIDKNKINQRDFAKAMGVYPSTASQWINGKREPKIATIMKICEIYNVSADWLLGIKESD